MCGGRQKDCANPEERGVRIYFVNPGCAWQSLNKFSSALAGTGFLPAGGCPAELPVMNFQVKPDRLLLDFGNNREIGRASWRERVLRLV